MIRSIASSPEGPFDGTNNPEMDQGLRSAFCALAVCRKNSYSLFVKVTVPYTLCIQSSYH